MQPGSSDSGHATGARSGASARSRTGDSVPQGPEWVRTQSGYPKTEVAPLPGWPRWLGRVNHQISGLAFRAGHLYAISDQSGVETSALLEIDLGENAAGPASHGSAAQASRRTSGEPREVDVRALCRWQGGPHPDAEGLALDPLNGPPRAALIPLESHADALLEIGFDDCAIHGTFPGLTGKTTNQGIEGVAVSPDGRTVYLVHETDRTLLTLPRGAAGPAKRVAKITDAESLCDIAYDDRGTPSLHDDRLLLLDRNGRQIFDVTLDGTVVALWHLSRWPLQIDPEGFPYGMIALEGLAIESREPDGSLLVYAATDTPPEPLPYRRTKGPKDTEGRYERRIGMLYRFRLPAVPPTLR